MTDKADNNREILHSSSLLLWNKSACMLRSFQSHHLHQANKSRQHLPQEKKTYKSHQRILARVLGDRDSRILTSVAGNKNTGIWWRWKPALLTVPALHVCAWGTRFQMVVVKIRTQSMGGAGSGHPTLGCHQRETGRDALLPPTLPIYTCSQPCIQSIHPHTHRHTPLSSSCSCWAAEHPAGHCASPALENNSQFVLPGFALVVQKEKFLQVQEPRGCWDRVWRHGGCGEVHLWNFWWERRMQLLLCRHIFGDFFFILWVSTYSVLFFFSRKCHCFLSLPIPSVSTEVTPLLFLSIFAMNKRG